MDAWLTIRGIKTLPVRMDRHSSNAQTIAEALVGHPKLDAGLLPRACPTTRATSSRRGR